MGFAARRQGGDLNRTGARARPDSPIDLVHLARQTMGDAALEKELLAMFDRQAAQIASILLVVEQGATSADLAHKLKGSARAIGANGIAAAAEHYEHAARAGLLAQADADRLFAETEDVRAFLRDLSI
ncbi:MAG TPA: Hpt domain-containing protein [Rhodoblastus sp.]|nr:Hpt domain-containing protein [Rhodoblastus sp.]